MRVASGNASVLTDAIFSSADGSFCAGAPTLEPGLQVRKRSAGDNDESNDQNARMPEPGVAIDAAGDEKIIFGDAAQNQTEQKRRALPVEFDHEPADGAEDDDEQHVAKTVFSCKAAEINQKKQKRYQIGPFNERDLGELVEKQQADELRS